MELLLPTDLLKASSIIARFTFQYGATSTREQLQSSITTELFTFQYGATSTKNKKHLAMFNYNLHSNMELLLHNADAFLNDLESLFTFQYGATSTGFNWLDKLKDSEFTFQYGATSTYTANITSDYLVQFTFQCGATSTYSLFLWSCS